MRIFASPLAASLWVLSAATAMAQAQPASELVESLLDERGDAYVAAREALLDRQDIVDVARAALGSTAYGPSTWLPLVLTEALAMHVTHREEAERLQDLEGLDSGRYLLSRVPAPSAARELSRLRHVAPLMIELFLKGVETYEWSSAATAEAEEEALRRDLLVAIGRSDHPASVYFLTDVIEGGCACCESCNPAVTALGETGSIQALPVLLEFLDEARGDKDVEEYATAVAALGRIRNARIWPYLEVELDSADPRIREAAVRSAGAYGSRWYWRDKPVQGAGIRAAIGSSLLDVLSGAEDEGVVLATLESIGSVATTELRDLLEQKRTRSRGVEQHRLQRALDRVNRTLAREQGGMDGAR